MVKLIWKQKEVIEFSDEDKAKLVELMRKKSISEERAIAKEVEKRIKHDIEVMANGSKLKLEKDDSGEYILHVYGIKFYYPGPDERLSGNVEATGVALDFMKKLLLKLSNHVVIKVSEGGTRNEYYKGESELDPDLFDEEEVDREEFLGR